MEYILPHLLGPFNLYRRSAMEWPDEDVRIYQGPVYYYLEGELNLVLSDK